MKEVYRLQTVIINSFSGQALAIRKVVTNAGGKTAGTDRTVWASPKAYFAAIEELSRIVQSPSKYRAKPLRRVMIPKGNTGEMRPLGIPTLIDRAVQAIYHLGVDPVVEVRSDKNSFGFRKGRSTHTAIIALRSHLDKRAHPH
jgi:RNA-directed DNA polymerase